MTSKVGIIGVGLMGHGIASNILKAGWPLTFLEHPGNQDTQDIIAMGARSRTDIDALTAGSDVIIICVTGSPESESVVFGGHGVLNGLKAGSTVIDCTTSIPATGRRIADAVQSAGANYLDAPMTRTPKEAAEGKLNLVVGGDADVFESQRPLLESFAENITHAGPIGAGHTMKLIHNFVSLSFSAVVAEAAASADRAGIDESVLVDVLGKGGGASVVLERLKPFILNGDSSGFRFSLSNAHKDLGYYLTMLESQNAPTDTATLMKNLYADAEEKSPPGSPIPELVRLLGDKP